MAPVAAGCPSCPRSATLPAMLETIVINGQVVTPDGAGTWDVGIAGGTIAAVAQPGTLPREGARVLDAAGRIVVPGGIDPHTHLAHQIMSHPEEPGLTMGPEDDTRGMAYGGTTTHIDFAYVRPGVEIQPAVEQRAARWKANSYVDYAFPVTPSPPPPRPPPPPPPPPPPSRQAPRRPSAGGGSAGGGGGPAGGLMVVDGEDE